MAVVNFIQTIWSKKIQDALELKCKLVNNCLRDYEGDVKQASTVKILGVGEPTIKPYDKNVGIEPEAMSDEGQDLVIDQANAFAFLVDDIDKAQSVPGLAEEYQRKSVHGLAVARDTYVATLIKGVTEGAVTAEDNTAEGIKEAIDTAIVTLRERNFDEEGVIELSPAAYNAFKNNLITLSTDNPDYIKRGIVGVYDGFEVAMHGVFHKNFPVLDDAQLKEEVAGDVKTLEKLCGNKIIGGAYPCGVYDEKIADRLRSIGIEYCRTIKETHNFDFPEDFNLWHPTCHDNDENVFALADEFIKLDGEKDSVFYIWGHSFELDKNDKDRWYNIEKLCEKLAGRKDIVYTDNAGCMKGFLNK
jgi:hypothetical protein